MPRRELEFSLRGENLMISIAPDWTPAASRYVSVSHRRTNRDTTGRDFSRISGWLAVACVVQKCPRSVAETPRGEVVHAIGGVSLDRAIYT
jgi:hypothetical protein